VINRLSGATKLMASVADYREAQRGQSPAEATQMPADPVAELNVQG